MNSGCSSLDNSSGSRGSLQYGVYDHRHTSHSARLGFLWCLQQSKHEHFNGYAMSAVYPQTTLYSNLNQQPRCALCRPRCGPSWRRFLPSNITASVSAWCFFSQHLIDTIYRPRYRRFSETCYVIIYTGSRAAVPSRQWCRSATLAGTGNDNWLLCSQKWEQ